MSSPSSPPQFPTPHAAGAGFDHVVGQAVDDEIGARRKRSSGRRVRRMLKTVTLVMLGVAVVIAAVAAWGLRRLGDLNYIDVAGVEPAVEGTASNWLLVGTDDRSGIDPDSPDALAFVAEPVSGSRTDTIMLVRVDRDARTVDVLSVPRDLWVPIAGADRFGRINGAFNGEQGRQRLVATIADVLDVPIHHYAEIDFVGFREMIDALGGVSMVFDHPARDVNSGLAVAEAGCQVLDGAQALAYARSRRYEEFVDGTWVADPTGDLGRTSRQRRLLASLVTTALDAARSARFGTIDDLVGAAGEHILVEDGASLPDLLSLVATFATIDGAGPGTAPGERGTIVGHRLPVTDHRTSGGAQVLQLSEAEAEPLLELFRTGLVPTEPSGPSASVDADQVTSDTTPDQGSEPVDEQAEPVCG